MIRILIILFCLTGCAGKYYTISNELPDSLMSQMNSLYPKWHERSFCVGDSIYNVLEGGVTTSPMPLCNENDIVFHTHPCWAENGANFIDLWAWDVYHNIFGNERFGIMYGIDKIKIYIRKLEYIGLPVVANQESIERIRQLNR